MERHTWDVRVEQIYRLGVAMSFVEFVFDKPSIFLVIAILFFCLGAGVVYFLTKKTDEYVKAVLKENTELRESKNKILHQLLEAENELKEYERQSRGHEFTSR